MNSETIQFLRDMRDLLEQGWTQLLGATDAEGVEIDACNPEATCWCLTGAIDKVVNDAPPLGSSPLIHFEAAAELAKTMEQDADNRNLFEGVASAFSKLIRWNDAAGRTQTHVLQCLDTTINRLKNQT